MARQGSWNRSGPDLEEMNAEWAEKMYGEGNSPALRTSHEKEEKRDEKVVGGVTKCCGTGGSLSK